MRPLGWFFTHIARNLVASHLRPAIFSVLLQHVSFSEWARLGLISPHWSVSSNHSPPACVLSTHLKYNVQSRTITPSVYVCMSVWCSTDTSSLSEESVKVRCDEGYMMSNDFFCVWSCFPKYGSVTAPSSFPATEMHGLNLILMCMICIQVFFRLFKTSPPQNRQMIIIKSIIWTLNHALKYSSRVQLPTSTLDWTIMRYLHSYQFNPIRIVCHWCA